MNTALQTKTFPRGVPSVGWKSTNLTGQKGTFHANQSAGDRQSVGNIRHEKRVQNTPPAGCQDQSRPPLRNSFDYELTPDELSKYGAGLVDKTIELNIKDLSQGFSGRVRMTARRINLNTSASTCDWQFSKEPAALIVAKRKQREICFFALITFWLASLGWRQQWQKRECWKLSPLGPGRVRDNSCRREVPL
jgi:hypothetical protein